MYVCMCVCIFAGTFSNHLYRLVSAKKPCTNKIHANAFFLYDLIINCLLMLCIMIGWLLYSFNVQTLAKLSFSINTNAFTVHIWMSSAILRKNKNNNQISKLWEIESESEWQPERVCVREKEKESDKKSEN